MHAYDFHSRRYYRIVATLDSHGARCSLAQASAVYLADAANPDASLFAIPGHGFREALGVGMATLAEPDRGRGNAPVQSLAAMRRASTAKLLRELGEPRLTLYPETFHGLASYRRSAKKYGLNPSLHAVATRMHATRRARG